jgi:hypothetical protein
MFAAHRWLTCLLLLLLTFGEARLFNRLLYADPLEYGFVLANVDGVLSGKPVSKSWQQRVLTPLGVRALDSWTHERLASLKLFGALLLTAANLALFWIARQRGNGAHSAFCVTAAFGLVHLLLLYKLEYPWDWLDVLLFLAFGAATARGRTLPQNWLWLVLGTLNHETILYVPLWYLLAPLDAPAQSALRFDGARKQALLALGALLAMSAAIIGLRNWLYVGPAALPGTTPETATPLIENHWHVLHNLQQWFWYDWREGRSFISASLTFGVAWLAWQLRSRQLRRAATWSLVVLISIVCFGYVNETRHYLLLAAFWFAYRCPLLQFQGFNPDNPMPSGK